MSALPLKAGIQTTGKAVTRGVIETDRERGGSG
jgi:hypothetical protein